MFPENQNGEYRTEYSGSIEYTAMNIYNCISMKPSPKCLHRMVDSKF